MSDEKSLFLRRIIASLLSASLLLGLPGGSFYEACAQTVAQPVSGVQLTLTLPVANQTPLLLKVAYDGIAPQPGIQGESLPSMSAGAQPEIVRVEDDAAGARTIVNIPAQAASTPASVVRIKIDVSGSNTAESAPASAAPQPTPAAEQDRSQSPLQAVLTGIKNFFSGEGAQKPEDLSAAYDGAARSGVPVPGQEPETFLEAVSAPVGAALGGGVSAQSPADASVEPHELGFVAPQTPGQPVIDPFGREIGWDNIPPAPAEAPISISQVDLDPAPGSHYTPSPEDWRDEVFYAVIMDRFGRTAPYTTWGDPADGRSRHGGNIRGLIDKLPYLKELGVTTLLINPLLMNPPTGSHQYWAVNFLAVDPQIGTLAGVNELVGKAHEMGMRIILDTVFNHTAPVAEYEGGFKFGPAKKIKKWNYPVKPVELQDEQHFTRRGDIGNWHNDEEVRYGDLPGGINKLNTENPATQELLIKIAKWWIRNTNIDGFRLDVYKHVAPSFWDRFFPEIREYAARLGKNNFFLTGELYDGDPNNIRPEVHPGRLDSAYNYPAYYWEMSPLHAQSSTHGLEETFYALSRILEGRLHYLLHFLDNHDRPRFLKSNEPEGILRFALAFVLLSIGIPYLYYGDEQGFRHMPANEWLDLEQSREDMFPEGKFKNVSAPDGGFNTQSSIFKLVSKLIGVRKENAALRRGEQFIRWSDPNGPGIFAFSRIHEGKEVLVVLNSSGDPRSAEMWVDGGLTPIGTKFVDSMDPGYAVTSWGKDGGSKVYVEVPPYGVRVLVREQKK
ncbi:MAG: alpha-amylase family glycosyl hydrolase [Elusimicrobiota bacterium]|jgi:glycosidase